MLTQEENELLTRTGPGTPMGTLLRRYWVPALLAEELPASDCPPVRVQLLGEELLAFRDSGGRVGLVDLHCAHRGASLYFGRNEEWGIRCVYHGWKYDVDGNCVDMPNEPANGNVEFGVRSAESRSLGASQSAFGTPQSAIKLKAYPCRERGGVVWAYMGQAKPAAQGGASSRGHLEGSGPVSGLPPLPELEWALVPDSQRCVSKRLQDCNYLQALEGGIDLSHLSFLHVYLDPRRDRLDQELVRHDPQPRFELIDTDYGLIIGARRDVDAESQYWRISHWLMPWYTSFPPLLDSGFGAHVWVPIDDEHCWAYSVTWDPDRPILVEQRAGGPAGEGIYGELLPGTFRPRANKDNDYLVDRGAQRAQSFTGIPGFAAQDCAAQESMGPICDRTREHLGTTDVPLVALRRRLLQGVRDLQAGREPFGLDAASYRVRPRAVSLPKTVSFEEAARDALRAD